MNVMWFSCGVSSAVCAIMCSRELEEILYIDIADQHEDSIRFLKDVENVIGKTIRVIRSEYFRDVESVLRSKKYINGPAGSPCTQKLKLEVRKRWEYENGKGHKYYWGMDVDEQKRANRIKEKDDENTHVFPLIDRNLTKQDAHGILERKGIRRPVMYDLGYQNNNCIGCVRGGMGYWNKIRHDFPDVFEKRKKLERDIGNSMINGKFLDQLSENDGINEPPISTECGIFCYINSNT